MGILDFIAENTDELVSLRRWFHQHPEVAYKEIETSKFIVSYLEKLGLEKIEIFAGTGIQCEIGTGGKIGACRFNMDALPISEKTNLPFQSLYPGFSHACGHDFELAWGLLIAKYFVEHPPAQTLRLLFQPAEEEPGEGIEGKTGGQLFAEMGLFDVNAIFSLHVDPEIALGTVSIIDGEVTCSAYDFEYRLQGKTCHAAKPQFGINPVLSLGKIISDLSKLEKRITKTFNSDESFLVLTPSIAEVKIDKDSIALEQSLNTIPEFAYVKGISRVRSKKVTDRLLKGLKSIQKKQVGLINAELTLVKRAPATINDTFLTGLVLLSCKENGINLISKRTTWRDDAGWGSEKAPTAHGFVGIGIQSGNLHAPHFNPDEGGLPVGLSVFLNSLNKFLNN